MRDYYVFKSGRISRKDDSIIITVYENGKESRVPIPIEDIDSLYLFGEIDLNTQALNFLAKRNVCLHTFNYYGWYTGTYYPKEFLISGDLTVRQSEHYLSTEKRLKIGLQFVLSGIHGMIRNMKRHETMEDEIVRMEGYSARAEECTGIDELMGIEGNARECYYSTFQRMIKQEVEFDKRVKNPPDNMMNALISFINGLIYANCLKEIYKTQLNPTISYLHEPGTRRFSLSLDVAEIFKPIYGDRILFELLNLNKLKKEHFDKDLNYAYLKEPGRKIVLEAFDEKLNTTIMHKSLKRKVSYRKIIRLELYKLIKHLLGEKEYKSLRMWW